MLPTETFPLDTVLTVYHNKMCVKFDEMRRLINYMCRGNVPLWEIPRARQLCVDSLNRQFKWLAQTRPPIDFRTEADARKFVKGVAKMLGTEQVEVKQLPVKTFVPLQATESIFGT